MYRQKVFFFCRIKLLSGDGSLSAFPADTQLAKQAKLIEFGYSVEDFFARYRILLVGYVYEIIEWSLCNFAMEAWEYSADIAGLYRRHGYGFFTAGER